MSKKSDLSDLYASIDESLDSLSKKIQSGDYCELSEKSDDFLFARYLDYNNFDLGVYYGTNKEEIEEHISDKVKEINEYIAKNGSPVTKISLGYHSREVFYLFPEIGNLAEINFDICPSKLIENFVEKNSRILNLSNNHVSSKEFNNAFSNQSKITGLDITDCKNDSSIVRLLEIIAKAKPKNLIKFLSKPVYRDSGIVDKFGYIEKKLGTYSCPDYAKLIPQVEELCKNNKETANHLLNNIRKSEISAEEAKDISDRLPAIISIAIDEREMTIAEIKQTLKNAKELCEKHGVNIDVPKLFSSEKETSFEVGGDDSKWTNKTKKSQISSAQYI